MQKQLRLRICCGDKIVDFPLNSEPIKIVAGLIADDKICAEEAKAQWGAFFTEVCKGVTGQDLSDCALSVHSVASSTEQLQTQTPQPYGC
ncbi:MAG: hypothetical protein R3B52_02260 [Candidatus Paceibacterota bacterium]